MSTASVLVCALLLLGRSSGSLPPIVLLDHRPPGVSGNAEAFVRQHPDTIYLLTAAPVFAAAQMGDQDAIKKIASIIAHEEWHVLHGHDERAAYQTQLATLSRLNAGPGTRLYSSVNRAMRSVLKSQPLRSRPQPALVAAHQQGAPIDDRLTAATVDPGIHLD